MTQPVPLVFGRLPWKVAAPGARYKKFEVGGQTLRLLELTPEFEEADWCEKTHAGLVLAGELEVRFEGSRQVYTARDGLMLPGGAEFKHKAKARSPKVRLFLVEPTLG